MFSGFFPLAPCVTDQVGMHLISGSLLYDTFNVLRCYLQLANAKSAEDRAKVDLKLHFMKKTLDEPVSAGPLLFV